MSDERTTTSPPIIALDVPGTAEALSLSPRTVEDMAIRGELPSFRVGRRRLFAVESLREWAAERTAEHEHEQTIDSDAE